MKRRIGTAVAVLVALAAALASTPAQAVDAWTVVADGLDNPRGLSFVPRAGTWHGRRAGFGTLYVAEAGRGGPGPCGPGGDAPVACYGPTGAITRITPSGHERVVTGLPSIAAPGGFGATGPTDVSLWNQRAFIPIGCGCTVAQRAAFGPGGAALATLARAQLVNGSWRPIADLGPFEEDENPDGEDINPNPYAALADSGHRLVIDAGGNYLVDVRSEGHGYGPSIDLLSVFPSRLVPAPPFLGLPPGAMIPMQSSPDSIVRGPDGAYYVGEFTGFPFPVGGARVYRIDPHAFGPPQVYATGFTTIIDLAFDEHGTLFVLEFQKLGLLSDNPTGALIRVGPGNSTTEIASTGLVMPGGLAIRDGFAYVSNFSVVPGGGEVVAIPLG